MTVTGSFDDACGCELGGLVITNNTENKLLVHKDIETYDVVIYVPERKIRKNTLDVENLRALDNQICAAIGIADGYPLNAMTMNGRIISEASGVDNSVAEKALQDGALGAGMSGSGPAIAMVFNEGRGQAYIDRSGLKNTILTKTRGIQS